jgi:cold shock CspA family protein
MVSSMFLQAADMPDEARQTGSVLWFRPDKAFGYLAVDGENRDIFFHVSEWFHVYDPRKGDRVSFIASADKNGRPRARQVVVVE